MNSELKQAIRNRRIADAVLGLFVLFFVAVFLWVGYIFTAFIVGVVLLAAIYHHWAEEVNRLQEEKRDGE